MGLRWCMRSCAMSSSNCALQTSHKAKITRMDGGRVRGSDREPGVHRMAGLGSQEGIGWQDWGGRGAEAHCTAGLLAGPRAGEGVCEGSVRRG